MDHSTVRQTIVAAVFIAAAGGAQAAPVSRDDFLIATTGNLVTLCSAAQADPMYTAALNFCHGFTVGTYRAIVAEEAASKAKHKLFCPPEQTQTRDQAVAGFVQWASARPNTLASSPTDGIVEYLSTQYPCK
jgi:Ssp1 endopeptidase immunity protein Rap1a